MASMRNWLHGGSLDGQALDSTTTPAPIESERDKRRVAVVHCKAGKGRSGSMTCSYLISQEGWTVEDAMNRFTERRMRPMFGAGVSIPSQVRWISYVDRWTKHGKVYRDRPIEILEIHTWGLRDGVKVEVEAFIEDGKKISVFHTFKRDERVIVEGDAPGGGGWSDMVRDIAGMAAATQTGDDKAKQKDMNEAVHAEEDRSLKAATNAEAPPLIQGGNHRAETGLSQASTNSNKDGKNDEPGGKAVIFRPREPILIPHNDVNIAVERRNRTHKSLGLTMVSAVGHVWFNTFFEGQGPEQGGKANDSGIFCIEWDAMDGIKGSIRKGSRALDRLAVVWRAADTQQDSKLGEEIIQPAQGQSVPQVAAADWKGPADGDDLSHIKDLGLRVQNEQSADVTRANSVRSNLESEDKKPAEDDAGSIAGVKSSGPSGEELVEDKK